MGLATNTDHAKSGAISARALRRAALIGGASALALTVSAPALAQDYGSGGGGGKSRQATLDGLQNGGDAGEGPNGEDGGDGSTISPSGGAEGGGGGGGGAGITGGTGGDGAQGRDIATNGLVTGGTGGAGGATPGAAGQAGANATIGAGSGTGAGGGGGGGGAHGGVTSANIQTVSGAGFAGGNGGKGGNGSDGVGYGGAGGGGQGGFGLLSTQINGSLVNDGSTITGGDGGDGGLPSFGGGGDGGDGGIGIAFTGAGNTFTNSGTVTGGAGGDATRNTFAGRRGTSGSGGVGIAGANLTVINEGSIKGGLSGDTGNFTSLFIQANAVTFGAGTNIFEYRAGSSVTGNVVGDGDDLFRLGGTTDGSFNVGQLGSTYQGFGTFEKTGSSVFTLTGSPTQVTPWTLTAGTLVISDSDSLGSNGELLTFNGGNLRLAQSIALSRDIAMSGNGAIEAVSGTTSLHFGTIAGSGTLTKTGLGQLILTGANGFTGGININAGSIGLDNASAASTGAITMSAGSELELFVAGPIANNITLTSGSANLKQASGSSTLSGIISGAAGIAKTGAGNLTLSGANTYTGTTTVSEGTLTVANNGALGTADGGTIVQDGATLSFNAPVLNIADAISITGTGASGAGALRLENGDTSLNGLVTLTGDSRVVVNEGAINFAGGVTGDYDLTLNGLGNLQRVVAFSGDLDIGDGTLTGNNITFAFYTGNSFTGDINVNSSTFEIAAGGADTISDTARVTMNSSGAFTRMTLYQSETIGSLAGSSGLVAGRGGDHVLTVGGDNTSTTFGGHFLDSGGTLALVKIGTGTLTLDHTGRFEAGLATGGVTIRGGAIAIRDDRVLGADSAVLTFDGPDATLSTLANVTSARNVVLNQDGIIDTAAGTTATFNGVFSGSNDLTKTGAGTLALGGANTDIGTTYLTEGTLRLANDDALSSLGLRASVDTTVDYADGITNAQYIIIDDGLIGPSATVTLNQSGGSATQSGVISGNASIAKTGTGNLILTRANSHLGVTTVSEGTLTVNNGLALGSSGTGTVVEDGATLVLAGVSTSEDISIAGGGANGSGALRVETGNSTLTGQVTLADAATITADVRTLVFDGGITGNHDLTFDGSGLSYVRSNLDIGDSTVFMNGSGQVILARDNSFTGDVVVNAGTLQMGLGVVSAYDTVNDLARVTVNAGGTLNVSQRAETIGSLAGNGRVYATYGGAVLTVGGDNTSTAFDGTIAESSYYALNLTKIGTGNLTLSGDNSHGGRTTVSAGTLTALSDNALGTTSIGTFVEDGATLALGSVRTSEDISIAGAGVGGLGALRSISGFGNLEGLVSLTGDATISSEGLALILAGGISGTDTDLTIRGGSTMSIASDLAIGNGTLTIDGTGNVALFADNSFTGDVVVNSGSLQLGSSGAPTRSLIADTARLTIAGAGTVSLQQASETIGSLAGSGGLLTSAAVNLTVGGDDTDTVFSGAIAETGAGSFGLTKIGTGTLTLGGTSAHSGGTAIQAGTVLVNGDQSAATGLTSVSGGATLGGNGIIGGDVTLADGASLNPGTSPGTLTINGNLSLSDSSILNFEFGQPDVPGGPLNDFVDVGGDLVLDGTLNVTPSAGGNFGAGIYRLFNYGGTLTDNGLALGSIPETNVFVQTSVANQVNLVNAAGATYSFWDGTGPANNSTIDGGSGVWQNSTGNSNWADATGALSGPYQDGSFAIFQGTAGSVSIDNSLGNVTASGLQFASHGYVIDGEALTLTGGAQSTVRVGDGTAAGSAFSASIAADIAGNTQLVKTDLGTLVLSGNNTYTGGTSLVDGTLQIENSNALGTGALATGAGTSVVLGNNVVLANAIELGGNTSLVVAGTNTLSGVISGTGALNLTSNGTLTLSGANTYSGGTTLRGFNILTNGSALGTGTITAAGGAITMGADDLVLANAIDLQNVMNLDNAGYDATLSGTISGTSGIGLVGSGTWMLTGANTYTGNTNIGSGTLRLANDAALGTGSVTLSTGSTIDYADGITIGNEIRTNNRFILNQTGGVATQGGVISGATGFTKTGAGTLVLSGANTFDRGVTLSQGTLIVTNDAALGTGTLTSGGGTIGFGADNISLANAIDLAAAGAFDTAGYDATLSGVISGSGGISKQGQGTLTLSGANTLGGVFTLTEGTLVLANNAALGTAELAVSGDTTVEYGNGIAIANGVTSAAPGAVTLVQTNGSATQGGAISGAASIIKSGDGALTLSGENTYTGSTEVQAGTLVINGNQSAATGLTSVAGGATLGGTGVIGGDVTLADNASLNPGTSPGTLTINGNLSLSGGSILNFEFGEAGVAGGALNDLVNVGGDLVLDGTLNVTTSTGGDFGAGVYRVFNYGGTLTDNGLALGSLPAGDVFVQTSVANQVNLINATGTTYSFWDGATSANNGAVDGGSGIWQSGAGNSNWTGANGAFNGAYDDGTFAIFQGAAGTVTIDNAQGAVTASSLQFASNGYVIGGDMLTLTGGTQSAIRVGDGTAAGAGFTAEIAADITGNTQLVKTDLGTLVLSGNNTYTGGTSLVDGTLQIGSNNALGTGTLTAADGTRIEYGAPVSIANAIELTGAVEFDATSGDAFQTGEISGAGSLNKVGSGSLNLTGFNTYTGGTTISGGTLAIERDESLGAASGSLTFAGSQGTLRLTGDWASTRNIALNGALGIIDNFGWDAGVSGTISGIGGLQFDGSGTVTLSGANTYQGGTTLRGGTLSLQGSNALGTGTLAMNAGTTVDYGASVDIANTIAIGSGSLVTFTTGADRAQQSGDLTQSGQATIYKDGTGNLVWAGDNAIRGTVIVREGTLTLASDTALGTTDMGTRVEDGATIALEGDRTINEIISIAGSGVDSLGALRAYGDETTFLRQVNVSAAATISSDGGVLNLDGGVRSFPSADVTFTGTGTTTLNGNLDIRDGSLIKNGAGSLQLVSNNTFTGDVMVNDGSLVLLSTTGANDKINDSARVTVGTGAALYLAQDSETIGSLAGGGAVISARPSSRLTVGGDDTSTTFSGVLAQQASSSLALTKTGTGTFTLTGDNAFSGGTMLEAGGIVLGSNTALGSGLLTADDNTTLGYLGDRQIANAILLNGALALDTGSNVITHSGPMGGAGSLTKIGDGTLQLSGNNEGMTGTVTVTAGTLRASGSAAVSDASALVLGGEATFEIADDEAIGSLSGSDATTVLLGENMLIAGINGDDTTFAGTISGTGNFVKAGTGTMTLTGENTSTGITAVTGGSLVLGGGNTIFDQATVMVENATLDLQANSETIGSFQLVDGTLAGSGTLIASDYRLQNAQVDANLGAGTLYQLGGTTVLNGTSGADALGIGGGTFRLGASERLADEVGVEIAQDAIFELAGASETIGAIYGTGTVSLGSGNLALGGTGKDFGFGGTFTGSGTISKTGGGLFTLIGDHALTGDLALLGGGLLFYGTTEGGVRIDGGTLSGSSILGGTLAMSSGMLSPGSEGQPFGVFQANTINLTGGTAIFDFTTVDGGMSDALLATGAINLSGVTAQVQTSDDADAYMEAQRFLIMQGGSLTGTFANGQDFATLGTRDDLFWRLRYDLVENGVALEVRQTFDFTQMLVPGATPNQIAVAGSLSTGQLEIGDAFSEAIRTLGNMSEADQLSAFDNLGGEGLTAATTGGFIESQRFADLLRQRLQGKALVGPDAQSPTQARSIMPVDAGQADALAAPDVASIGMWMQAYGGATDIEGAATTRDFGEDSNGIAGGLEARYGGFQAGVAVAFSDHAYNVRSLDGTMRGDTRHIGAYLGYEGKAAFAGVFGAWQESDLDSLRTIRLAGQQPRIASAEIDMDGRMLGGFAGLRTNLGHNFTLTPMLGVTNIRVDRDSFEENGADPLNLQVAEESREITTGSARLRLSTITQVGSGAFEPYIAGGVERSWGDLRTGTTMRFAGAVGGMEDFFIIGAPLEETVGVVGGGFEVRPTGGLEIGASAQMRIGDRVSQGTVEMHARIRF